ncbi:centrosomal protein of 70 kda [Anaeramoeba ignava]|uniref:Centrosomal protein of 70 kDa n=1 Tax=Anaeramoeba ignava TaxID=1746090 RepID=A0A9Q0LKU0_ANAIG|nr:centrosomal protein of 70 kda [Anaeramoeba ignava]
MTEKNNDNNQKTISAPYKHPIYSNLSNFNENLFNSSDDDLQEEPFNFDGEELLSGDEDENQNQNQNFNSNYIENKIMSKLNEQNFRSISDNNQDPKKTQFNENLIPIESNINSQNGNNYIKPTAPLIESEDQSKSKISINQNQNQNQNPKSNLKKLDSLTTQKQKEAGKIISDSLQQIFAQAKTIYPTDSENEMTPKYDLLFVNDQLVSYGFNPVPNDVYQNEEVQRKYLIERITQILDSLKKKDSEVEQLSQDVFSLQQKIQETNLINQKYDKENQLLKQKIQEMETENNRLKQENQSLSQRLSSNNDDDNNDNNNKKTQFFDYHNFSKLSPSNSIRTLHSQQTEKLDSICSALKINDSSMIIPKINEIKNQMSSHQKFVDQVFDIVEPLEMETANQFQSKFTSILRENKPQQIIQRLYECKDSLSHLKKLNDFKQKIYKELDRINLNEQNQLGISTISLDSFQSTFRRFFKNSNVSNSQLSLQKILSQIGEIVDFYISHSNKSQKQNEMNQLNYFQKDSIERTKSQSFVREHQIINHFKQLFQISSDENIISSMNNLFLEVQEASNRLQTLRETLNLNPNSSFHDCISEIYELVYYSKISKTGKF